MRWLVTLAIACALALPATTSAKEELGPVAAFHVLSFNRWGELSSPVAAALIAEELSARPDIERVIVISHGWANDAEVSYDTYREIVADLLEGGDAEGPPTAVIGVGWDSSQTGFRKLFNDLIPFPVMANWLAYLPDAAIFPISFWSKAAMADRIGYGGLRTALNEIFAAAYRDPGARPDILLIGHSFGARIVSGLMKHELALAEVRAEPFHAADKVRAALLFQPALALPNLHRNADYPILVTQSRHDHANGFLFPIANVVVNAYSFTSFEGLLRARVFGVVSDTARRGAEAVLPDLPDLPGELPDIELPLPPLVNRPYYLFERGMAELASVPFALAYSAVTMPFNYLVAQGRGLANGPIDHTMDTLAQLPVIEILVDGASALVGREVAWGVRSKGFLDLGLLNESPGRLLVAPYEVPRVFPVVAGDATGSGARGACGATPCRGLVFLDASALIQQGALGLGLERRWVDYTLGWLDPIGAHTDYRKPEIVELLLHIAGDEIGLASRGAR